MAGIIKLPIKVSGINVTTDYQPIMLDKDIINRLCIIGDTVNTRGTPSGVYTSLAGVKEHYGDDSDEYNVADRLFSQVPRPKSVMIATVADIAYPVELP